MNELTVDYPAYSVNTYIFTIDNGSTAIQELKPTKTDDRKTYYDLHGRRLETPHSRASSPTRSLSGLCIEKHGDGTTKKLFME